MTNWENTLVELINDYRPDIDLMEIPHSIAEKGEKRAQVGDLAEAYVHFWLRRIPDADFNIVNILNESNGLRGKLLRNLRTNVTFKLGEEQGELDDIFMYGGKTHLVEVKSGKLNGFTSQISKYTKIRDSLSNTERGLILLFYRTLGRENPKNIINEESLRVIDLRYNFDDFKRYANMRGFNLMRY